MGRLRAALLAAALTACNAPERASTEAGPEKPAEFRGIATAAAPAPPSASVTPRDAGTARLSAADRERIRADISAAIDALGDAGPSPGAAYFLRRVRAGGPTDNELWALGSICESRSDGPCVAMARAEVNRRAGVESTYDPDLMPANPKP